MVRRSGGTLREYWGIRVGIGFEFWLYLTKVGPFRVGVGTRRAHFFFSSTCTIVNTNEPADLGRLPSFREPRQLDRLRHSRFTYYTACGKTFHGLPRNLPRPSTAYDTTLTLTLTLAPTLTLTLILTLGTVGIGVSWELPEHAVELPWSAVGDTVAVGAGVAMAPPVVCHDKVY